MFPTENDFEGSPNILIEQILGDQMLIECMGFWIGKIGQIEPQVNVYGVSELPEFLENKYYTFFDQVAFLLRECRNLPIKLVKGPKEDPVAEGKRNRARDLVKYGRALFLEQDQTTAVFLVHYPTQNRMTDEEELVIRTKRGDDVYELKFRKLSGIKDTTTRQIGNDKFTRDWLYEADTTSFTLTILKEFKPMLRIRSYAYQISEDGSIVAESDISVNKHDGQDTWQILHVSSETYKSRRRIPNSRFESDRVKVR